MSLPEEEWKRRAEEALKISVNGGIKFDDDKPDY